ncbi:MAG: hypothetical protein ACOVP4_02595 [Bacteriovoracaceae bacterium]
MKKLLYVSAFILSSSAFAQVLHEARHEAVIRTKNYKAKIEKVTLSHLLKKDCFEGKYFKMVKGKDNEAICFDHTDKELKLRAATVYYHLSKAHQFYTEQLKSEFVKSHRQMVIRLEITQQFNELGHFGNDNITPEYNNALSIPAGRGLESRGVKPWGNEIWFRPSKSIHISELNARSDSDDFQGVLKAFRSQTHMTTLQRFISTVVQGQLPKAGGTSTWIDFAMRTVGSSVIMEAGYQASGPLNKLLSRKWYKLDTALVPEIIYHEYSHIALSDRLELSHSTAVIEGMADYFSGVIANSPKLAKKIKKYNTFNGKNAKNKKDFIIQFETTDYANTDFVFGLLWDLRRILGDHEATKFVYALRGKVTTNSSIRNELIEGILKTCEDSCANPFIDKISILQQLNLRGI